MDPALESAFRSIRSIKSIKSIKSISRLSTSESISFNYTI